MKKLTMAALITLPCLGMYLSPLQAEPLKEVIQNLINTNPDILTTINHRRSIDHEVGVARGGYYPVVDLTLGYGRERTDNPFTRTLGVSNITLTRRETEMTLRQMLFDGSFVGSEVDRQLARQNSSAYSAYGTSEQISLNAVEAYIDVLHQQELVDMTKDNLENHQRIFDQIKMRSDNGVGRKADLDQAQGRLSLVKSNLLSAESLLSDAKTKFRYITGQDAENMSKPVIPERLLPTSEMQAVQVALENHPTLKSAMADIDAAHAQHEAAKALLFPRLDLELAGQRDKNLSGIVGDANNWQAMLRLRYNLFSGNSDAARSDQTALLSQEATDVSNHTRRQVEQAIKLSWNAYETATARLDPLKDFVDASASTREAYGKQFNLGQRTLLDLLDSENEYFTASTSYLNGQYTQMFAEFRLLQNEGKLLESLGIQLPEELIAPEEKEKQRDQANKESAVM